MCSLLSRLSITHLSHGAITDSLQDLLTPGTQPHTDAVSPLNFFSMAIQCSVTQDVARSLAYLHEQSPPIIHRDKSARNLLLNSGTVAKIADLGIARTAPRTRAAANMTKGPGASIYMTPEATAPPASNAEKSKYDTSIGIFSFGVVSLSTIGEIFCYDPLAPTYTDHKSGLLVARTELQQRSMYIGFVNSKLRGCAQLRADQPFIRLIQQCLQNLSTNRPVIHKIQCLLEEARGSLGDRESETDRRNISGVPRGGGGSGCSSTPISLLLNAALGLRNSVLHAIQ